MSHLFQTYINCILIWVSTYSYPNIEWFKSSDKIKSLTHDFKYNTEGIIPITHI